ERYPVQTLHCFTAALSSLSFPLSLCVYVIFFLKHFSIHTFWLERARVRTIQRERERERERERNEREREQETKRQDPSIAVSRSFSTHISHKWTRRHPRALTT